MKKIIGVIIIILMIPIVISIIGDVNRTPIYPTTEFNIIDKPTDKQLLSNDKLLYQLPNTVEITTNELPQYVEYYEYGTLEVDSGILNYTINDNLAYINYIESELTQVVEGELIFSKPTQIISKSSNLNKFDLIQFGASQIVSNDFNPLLPNKTYTLSFSSDKNIHQLNIEEYDVSYNLINDNVYYDNLRVYTFNTNVNTRYFKLKFYSSGGLTIGEVNNIQLNEGTIALPYQPFAEHIYNLDNDIELYKLPNGVGDRWLQDGTLEKNVGIIDTVDNYAEYGTLSSGTYDNILEFINDNQNQNIKIFYDDIIQEGEYNVYLENNIILISNDTEFIKIYENDTYTSIRNLDTNITYKLEGYNIIDYTDGKLDDTSLSLLWFIPVLLAGAILFLLITKRKE